MTEKEKKHYATEFRRLRNVIDAFLVKLEEEEEPAAPRQRRNLKAERINHFEVNYATGTWKKPKHLRKT
jgi:hypothetical protein